MAKWHEIAHPCLWFTAEDLPRLKANAELPFWKPKFDQWRRELTAAAHAGQTQRAHDFHKGGNTQALQAALCYVVDGEPHFGQHIGRYLTGVADFYRKHGPTWRTKMCSKQAGDNVGQQWGGLTGNHIVDPQMWHSCAHLYDVIHGQDFMDPHDAETFEEMMALFHQLACLHEEMSKQDNNRSAWLMGGSYVSTLFDPDELRAELCRQRHKQGMQWVIQGIMDDGIQYEIDSYAQGTIAAIHKYATALHGVEGIDLYRQRFDGVGLEDAFRAWVGLLIPGSSLRLPWKKDRINHWDSTFAGYRTTRDPALGWAISRVHERTWVPMFKHWPQGAEFYSYEQPTDVHPPRFLDSHFPSAGLAMLRSSWEPDARSLFFKYGFQGSSHGGGLDRLNIELTCNDEPLISDSQRSEYTHHKNLVVVDGQCQLQCSGKLLQSSFDKHARVQYVSAIGGFGQPPDRAFFHDPRIEYGYWCTRNQECFPGVARMRRLIAFIDRRFIVVRDTLRTLDDQPHDYQWLFQSFARVDRLTGLLGARAQTYHPKPRNHNEKPKPETRLAERYGLTAPGRWALTSERAWLEVHMLAIGAAVPEELGLARGEGDYRYNGSPETGDGLETAPMVTVDLELHGRDVVLTSVMEADAQPRPTQLAAVTRLEQAGLDCELLRLEAGPGSVDVLINESDAAWRERPPGVEVLENG